MLPVFSVEMYEEKKRPLISNIQSESEAFHGLCNYVKNNSTQDLTVNLVDSEHYNNAVL